MRVTVNGNTIEVPDGSNVSVVDGTVIINGSPVGDRGDAKVNAVVIDGKAGQIKTDYASIEVKGEVFGDVRAGGSIRCGNVDGSVNSGGSLQCGNVTGNANAGGSMQCGHIGGSARCGGSMRCGS